MLKHIYKLRYVLAFTLTVITITLTLLPAKDMPETGLLNIPYGDKLGHALAYISLGFSWHLVCQKFNKSELKVLIGLFLLGIILEFGQFYFLVGRYFEMFDIIANIIGAIAGIALQRIFYVFRRSHFFR